MKPAAQFAIVLVTAPALKTARALAKAALEAKLIACANLLPKIESHYWWQGKLESSAEVLLILKTPKARLAALETELAALRSEVGRLATRPIAPAELDKVRTRVLTAALKDRQTPMGQAMAVGRAVIASGDPQFANRDLAALQSVTAADVQRVLRQYVVGQPSLVIDYTQAPATAAAPAPASSKGTQP